MDDSNHSHASTPERIVFGHLTKTPLTHLVLDLLARRATGTLVVEADAAHAYSVSVGFRGGAIVAVAAPVVADLDESVVALVLRRGGYVFHTDRWVAASRSTCERGCLDPVQVVATAIARGMCDDEVHAAVTRVAAATVFRRAEGFELERLGPLAEGLGWLREQTDVRLTDLLGRRHTELVVACRQVHALLLTSALVPPGTLPRRLPPCRPTSGEWAVSRGEDGTETDAQAEVSLRAERRAQSLYSRALAHCRGERWDEAVSNLRSAIVLAPEVSRYHETLAWVMLRHRRGGSAASRVVLGILDRAVTLDPSADDAHYMRGCVLEGLGDRREAARAYLHASKLNPRHAQARAGLWRVSRRPG